MPLKEVYPGAKVTTALITCGPWCEGQDEFAKDDIIKFVDTKYGAALKRRHAVAEHSDDGYKHIHCAIEFVERTKCYSLKFDIQKHITNTWKRDPTETRSPNCGLHLVPDTEPDKEGRSNYDHIAIKYMSDPTKDKTVDENITGGENRTAMPDWYNDYCRLLKVSSPLDHWNKDKQRMQPIGELMANDYKFYKKQDPYYQRLFDVYFRGHVKWRPKN